MTNDCYNLVKLISAVIGEYPDGDGFDLLCERMVPLINAGAVELCELDAAYRRLVLGETVTDGVLPTPIADLNAALPICDRLAHALGFYAASLYVRDESPDLSEALLKDYKASCDAVRAVVKRIEDELASETNGDGGGDDTTDTGTGDGTDDSTNNGTCTCTCTCNGSDSGTDTDDGNGGDEVTSPIEPSVIGPTIDVYGDIF